MRFLGVDFGQRRIGLALSDASGMLARPWQTIPAAGSPAQSASALATRLLEWAKAADDDATDLAGIVVGLPRRLNGDDNAQTAAARAFAAALAATTSMPVVLQDERLSSHEAEQRLSVRERDWRKRKEKLDAAAAAVILQDYLDARSLPATAEASPTESW